MRRDPGPDKGQGGFAAVDALVAITILSLSLALSLAAAQTGVQASRVAGETHDAELLLRDHLALTVGQVGGWNGREQGLNWRITAGFVQDTPSGQIGACLRTATAKSLRTGHFYRIVTADTCRAETPTGRSGA